MSLSRWITTAFLASMVGWFVLSDSSAQTGSGRAITYPQVLQLLELKIDDEAILKRLGGTTFVLDAQQEAELRKAGASDRLLAAMRKAPMVGANTEVSNWAIILDCSKSMQELTPDGTTKMEVAKKAMIDLLRDLPNGLKVTFIIYGHDAALECAAVKVVRPLSPLDNDGKADLALIISELKPTGHTPISLALAVARKELAKNTSPSGVILITDGMETCHGDPVDEARKLQAKLGVNVVGFGLNDDERRAVSQIAKAGNGKFYAASSAVELTKEMTAVREVVKAAAPVKSQVDEMGETSVDKPAVLKLGTPARVVLERNQSAYASVKLPVGEYSVILDVRRNRSTNIQGSVSVLDEDGAELLRGLMKLNYIDSGYRTVGKLKIKTAQTVILKVTNDQEPAEFWLTVIQPSSEKRVPFYGTVNPTEIRLDQETTKLLQKDESAYYAVTVPKGQYKVVVGYTNARGASSNVQGYAAVLDSEGGDQNAVIKFNEINVSSRKSAQLMVDQDMTVIIRLKNDSNAMKTSLIIRPVIE